MFKKIKKTTRIIITIIIAAIIIVAAFIRFNAHYTEGGIITEIREDIVFVKQSDYGNYKGATIGLLLEEKSRFYDIKGNEIPLSGLKVGDHIKARLFPRVYGGLFYARPRNTVRWIRVLPN